MAALTPAPGTGGIERRLERAGIERWRRTRGREPEPSLRVARKGRRYEVTASSGGRSATLWLSERFVGDLLTNETGAACEGCADRFFEKLFERFPPLEDQQVV